MRWPGFSGPSYVSQSPTASNERLVNYYVESVESQGSTVKAALYPVPGVSLLDEPPVIPKGVGRAHYFDPNSGREFAVIERYFVEFDSAGLISNANAVLADATPATICGNGPEGGQIFITSGGYAYLFTLATNVFTQITALDGIATMGTYLGGYFLCLNAAIAKVFISDLLDGATWDPTQFFQRSAAADGWISMIANQYLYLFGTQTSEVWFNSGAFPIPFELHPSGRLQYGTAAPYSPEVVGTSVIWVGATNNGHGSVLRTSGFAVEVVSNFAVHYALDSYPTLEDGIGDSYEEFGHTFYIITFPTANHTWCFDASMELWHERSTFNSDKNIDECWRPLFHAYAFGEHRMLDLRGNRLYKMSTDFGFDVESIPIRRVRRPPALMVENKRVFVNRIELLLESGLGLTTGQGSDPVVLMRMSYDGGKTWGNLAPRSAGKRGEYDARQEWLRCGQGRKVQPEFIVSDPIPWRLLDLYVDAQPGLN